jgi:hypothetical protein
MRLGGAQPLAFELLARCHEPPLLSLSLELISHDPHFGIPSQERCSCFADSPEPSQPFAQPRCCALGRATIAARGRVFHPGEPGAHYIPYRSELPVLRVAREMDFSGRDSEYCAAQRPHVDRRAALARSERQLRRAVPQLSDLVR